MNDPAGAVIAFATSSKGASIGANGLLVVSHGPGLSLLIGATVRLQHKLVASAES